MGFRFRKSFKIAPGIRLNLSKSGVSTSIGGKGATVNVSKRGVRSTVGIPGSGISYSTSTRSGKGSGTSTSSSHLALTNANRFDGIVPDTTLKPGGAWKGAAFICLALGVLAGMATSWWIIIAGILGFFVLKEIGKDKDKLFYEGIVLARAEKLLAELHQKALDDGIALKGIESLESIQQGIKTNIQWAHQYLNSIQSLLNLTKKHGTSIGYKLYSHDYFIGMTKEQLYDCKGAPTKSEISAAASGTKETLIYGTSKQAGDWFVLQDDIVIKFVDK